jgi:uncharacterized membrane protein
VVNAIVFVAVMVALCLPLGFVVGVVQAAQTRRMQVRPPARPPRRTMPLPPSPPVLVGGSTVARARQRYVSGDITVEQFEAEMALAVYMEDAERL